MIYIVMLILVLANGIFWLVPGGKIAGVVKPADIGLLLLFAGVAWSFMRPQVLTRSRDPIAISCFVLLVFFSIQASLASFSFGQSIMNGVVAIRDQFYYLSFFVFLAVLNSEENIKRFLNGCSMLALVLGAIAIVDYIFGGVYKHQFAESQSIRSSIVRGQVAGMDIITLSLIWQMAKLTAKNTGDYSGAKFGLSAVFFMGIHFFRQTRSRLLAVTMVLGWLLYKSKQKMLMFSTIAVVIIAALVAGVMQKENIILSPFFSTVEVAQDFEGTISGRVVQLKTDLNIFLENPILGGGSAALRASDAVKINISSSEASEIARKSDLGYSHWLKAYGLFGVFWLIWFYLLLWARLKRISRQADKNKSPVAIFMLAYFYFVVISFITLNHFMFGYRIMLICALAAMAVNLSYLFVRKPALE